ncbi:GPN-loop GTPase 1 [Drosophila guanche]|uniref:GPN-loop GTPase n=1 Tax=Drosophila guanche TaxID=7266 RepID=A0A3B0JB49_DROGU|nr:GPN-loop GTPase 1 [Drosophila guanche]SPP79577.1 blast:GPN-loop GTPase 1 [Drosophila guanche]
MAAKASSSEASLDNIKLEALSLSEGIQDAPVCIIVLGMAGSGKTTFTRSLIQHAQEKFNPYVVNLDPACREVPYATHIDIRDTVNYKEVMKQYQLGPNGGIVTALNMFTTKMAKFAELVRRAGQRGHKWCIIDTPGQIEVFTWSASGNIITEGLATMFPTIIVYVMDVDALEQEQSFVNNLTRTMSLTLDTFYENLVTCGVSAKTGVGFAQLLQHVLDCVKEYEKDYKPVYEKMRKERMAEQQAKLQPSSTVEDSGTAVPMGVDLKDPPPYSGNNMFLMAPGLVPQQMDSEELEDDTETDGKGNAEEQNFHTFVQSHLTAQESKRNKFMQEQQKP